MDQIEHFIVLMLENRSFDHMFGYLEHPDPSFTAVGKLANAPTTPNARYAIYPGPDHSHFGVLQQMLGVPEEELESEPHTHRPVTMSGFADNYDKRLRDAHVTGGDPSKVLRCFDPRMVPVLSTLALGYGVCDHWFCALPGETWPNRDFAHAGESFGYVDVASPFAYAGRLFHVHPPTIFGELDRAPAPTPTWRVYHQGIAHTMLYTHLFRRPGRLGDHAQLEHDIRGNHLPSYAFVEPDYGLPGAGNSQHPSQAQSREEFVNGEALIARIYNALRETPDVFRKTAFVITYDEHGGFYDHVPPPITCHPKDTAPVHDGTNHGAPYRFSYGICGPRVPAVVVSPWVRRGAIDHTPRDHSCIPETIRKRFLANVAYPLNDRGEGTDLSPLFDLVQPRPPSDWPEVEPLTHDRARELEVALAAPADETDQNPRIDISLQTAFGDVRVWLRDHGLPV